MRKMKHFQDLGHRVVFVIGDFTGMIGDPTGQVEDAPAAHARGDRGQRRDVQAGRPSRSSTPRGPRSASTASGWARWARTGWIRLAATYNVARMLERRDFRQRFDAGPAHLRARVPVPAGPGLRLRGLKADVELGGTDQLFNLNVGRDIMPAYGLRAAGGDDDAAARGHRTASRRCRRASATTSASRRRPRRMFAKVLSISDELMWRYYLLLTDLDAGGDRGRARAGRPMESKMALARRIVADFHGAAPAAAAEAEWRRVHQRRELPSEMPAVQAARAPGRYKPHELLVAVGAGAVEERGRAAAAPARRASGTARCSSGARDRASCAGASFVVSVGRQHASFGWRRA